MRARMAAIASRVPFKVFMAHLMLSSTPITATPLVATPIKASPISSCTQPALAGSAYLEQQGQALGGDANANSPNSDANSDSLNSDPDSDSLITVKGK
jgi:hypothetical protein